MKTDISFTPGSASPYLGKAARVHTYGAAMLVILRSRFAEPRPAARNGIAARPPRAPAASRRHKRFDRNPPPLILIPVSMSDGEPKLAKSGPSRDKWVGFRDANPRSNLRRCGGGVSGPQTVDSGAL